MKIPYLIIPLSLLFAVGLVAQPCAPVAFCSAFNTLTQSMDNSTIGTGAGVCQTAPPAPFFHGEYSYFRSYTLINEGITGNIDVVAARFGVNTAVSASGQGQPVQLRLYRDPAPDPAGATINLASLQLLHTEMLTVVDAATGTFIETFLSTPVSVGLNDTLVVELFVPSGLTPGNYFVPAGNALGECSPTFWNSLQCGTPVPLTASAAGVQPVNVILDVCYQASFFLLNYPGGTDDLEILSAVNSTTSPLASKPSGGLGKDVKAANIGDYVTLRVYSPLGTVVGEPLFVVFEPFTTGSPPTPLLAFPCPTNPVAGCGVHVGLGFSILVGFGGSPYGLENLPALGWNLNFQAPAGLSGQSVLFQAATTDSGLSGSIIQNFAFTDGHQITFL